MPGRIPGLAPGTAKWQGTRNLHFQVHGLDEGPLNPAHNLVMLVHPHGHSRSFMPTPFQGGREEGIVRVVPVLMRCQIFTEAD